MTEEVPVPKKVENSPIIEETAEVLAESPGQGKQENCEDY
jgi:hypothetical protein